MDDFILKWIKPVWLSWEVRPITIEATPSKLRVERCYDRHRASASPTFPEDLLAAVSQLSPTELDDFTNCVLALRSQQQSPELSKPESDLLAQINQGLPETTWHRYRELIAKHQNETLTSAEYGELLSLTEQVESLDAQRLEYLVELARLRQITLLALMESLDLQPLNYG